MDRSIVNFLNKFKVDKSTHYSHVGLFYPKGRFQFTRDSFEKLFEIYATCKGKKGIADTTGSTILEPIYDGLKVNDSKNIILILHGQTKNIPSEELKLTSDVKKIIVQSEMTLNLNQFYSYLS